VTRTEQKLEELEEVMVSAVAANLRKESGQLVGQVRRTTDNPLIRKAAAKVTLENRNYGRCAA
jgi:hypothetical protein